MVSSLLPLGRNDICFFSCCKPAGILFLFDDVRHSWPRTLHILSVSKSVSQSITSPATATPPPTSIPKSAYRTDHTTYSFVHPISNLIISQPWRYPPQIL